MKCLFARTLFLHAPAACKNFLPMLVSALWIVACRSQSPGPAMAPPATLPPAKPPVVYTFDTTAVSWADEFNYTGPPDPAKWSHDVGGHGWGNNELQYYTAGGNASVADGRLIIEIRKEAFEGRDYTSARLSSKSKADFLYGRMLVRAKLPAGRGTWPAIWMLASTTPLNWPEDGELDIMEHVGFDPGVVHANIHTKAFNHSIGTNKGNKTPVPDAMQAFHVYGMDWTPDEVVFSIDGKPYFTFGNDQRNDPFTWPFNQKFHFLINTAVGGNWGGAQGVDDSIFPQRFEVDYVRVYKLK